MITSKQCSNCGTTVQAITIDCPKCGGGLFNAEEVSPPHITSSDINEIAENVLGKEKSALDVQVGGSHYKNLPIQPVEYCQKNRLNYCESAAIKYITRHKEKNGVEDIKKAIHYLQLLIELDYPSKP